MCYIAVVVLLCCGVTLFTCLVKKAILDYSDIIYGGLIAFSLKCPCRTNSDLFEFFIMP